VNSEGAVAGVHLVAQLRFVSSSGGFIAGVFAATGQTYMAGRRLTVHVSVHDEMVQLVAERATQIRLGDPNDAEIQMGPVRGAPARTSEDHEHTISRIWGLTCGNAE
jgi:acyl-CoA reductase-like NAD-dependent aldehyde dehydrogenase